MAVISCLTQLLQLLLLLRPDSSVLSDSRVVLRYSLLYRNDDQWSPIRLKLRWVGWYCTGNACGTESLALTLTCKCRYPLGRRYLLYLRLWDRYRYVLHLVIGLSRGQFYFYYYKSGRLSRVRVPGTHTERTKL
jgi:hypothetical protein